MATRNGNNITLTVLELNQLVSLNAKIAVNKTLVETGAKQSQINISEAYRRADSRRRVDNAVRNGLLHTAKKGNNTVLGLNEFEEWLIIDEYNE
jgi:hypothetical protein